MTNIFLANLHTLENTHHGRGPVHPVPGVQLNIVAASILYQQERAECTDHKLVNKVNISCLLSHPSPTMKGNFMTTFIKIYVISHGRG